MTTRRFVHWTPELEQLIKDELSKVSYGKIAETIWEIAKRTGEPLDPGRAKEHFRLHGLGRLSECIGKGSASDRNKDDAGYANPAIESDDDPPTARRPASVGEAADGDIRRLVKLAQDHPMSLEEACDELNLSPRLCKALVEKAQELGYAVNLYHDELHWKLPDADETIQETGVAPVVGAPVRIAVISDLHFGSKWCGRAQLRDFLDRVVDFGITEVIDPGDNLDGNYKFSLYEQSHRGFDEQCDDAYALFKDYAGLRFHTIDGNHDDTLSESVGMACGRAMVERFQRAGLDWHYYGSRGAVLNMYGAKIQLWHPRGGGAYALSYKLQKKIESFAPGQKPDILLTGHYHQAAYITERGVHGFLCPTFQLPGGSFSNSLTGSPSVGGMILGWEITEDGTLRRFHVERTSYYAGEKPRDA